MISDNGIDGVPSLFSPILKHGHVSLPDPNLDGRAWLKMDIANWDTREAMDVKGDAATIVCLTEIGLPLRSDVGDIFYNGIFMHS